MARVRRHPGRRGGTQDVQGRRRRDRRNRCRNAARRMHWPPLHSPRQVVVRTYNKFGVAPRELATALETARSILNSAAIDLVWRECGPVRRPARPERELIVRIVAAPAQAEPESLGYSLVDIRQRSGSLATIFADRVESMATAAEFDPGVLLGRTIAHELAHLLIGTTEHSAHGLMRARWNTRRARSRSPAGLGAVSRRRDTDAAGTRGARAAATRARDSRRGGRRASVRDHWNRPPPRARFLETVSSSASASEC